MNQVKRAWRDLAVFGGQPAFDEPLHVGRPNIGSRRQFFQQIEDILDRRQLSNDGPYVQSFERELSQLTGVKHCVAVSNATVGLEIAIRALGLTGEVIAPSMTFVATAHALQWLGITPVFCDIDPQTMNLDPTQVEVLITPQTSGIVGVHLWGRPCATEALADIARRHNLKLLYDAAHAVGCSYKGQMIGNFGDAEVFSFHATKVCNALEGGIIATHDDALAGRLRRMRNFGFMSTDNVVEEGTNGKMNEISAAMGLTSLAKLDSFIAENYFNYKTYERDLADIPGVTLTLYNEGEKNNYHYIVLQVDEKQTGISRDQLILLLFAENVLARRYFYPGCHRMEPYRTLQPDAGLRLPYTESLVERTLCLPTGTAVSPTDIQKICQIIRFAVENAASIRAQLLHNTTILPTSIYESGDQTNCQTTAAHLQQFRQPHQK
ncbi:MAG: aminotransferase class I/II-fold pyridoxal phosphate-dependent enzyme [Ardenticatenaceae bacterium]|nr:aminotransferase class I/II-fold pyridoxal phosphate-dependent enzyme [Ardenticatenaceae bacterium]MCB9004047.1 aminotransferase class I/II-fold pyridoxal phosphate-dependent enzyme [Ardenticatenaceae bacterium]